MRRNICVVIGYDGTDYNGFQSQPGGNTVQDKLEDALLTLTGENIRVTGSGRTDAGVHARSMHVNFRTDSHIPASRWTLALNARLPDDIVVHSAFEVPDDFHARRTASRKTYRYTINCNKNPDVFRRKYEFHHHTPLNVEAMREGLQHLIGEHDFSSFTSPLSTKPSHIRTLYEARLETEHRYDVFSSAMAEADAKRYPGKQRGIIHLYVTGNGFLYNMVRIIAGTMMQVGEGKIAPEHISDILNARDRSRAGPTAVPHGLTLWNVEYGETLPLTDHV
ncbi:tRNA pseudouridine(38-40) synthase TruA [Cohnella pontilimi]|uniref:tRNA pseudouridine synthase A n=1 Tax=Cohnella pontilimi TaxID=2564100 RepID=A0A4U0F3F2_9BACL|nr:tRNA pseudouridine(38-40) synthase TruA [Cohnella pontilimi]TJY38840.1 tRNA pseudouridine(38-40) synthase TruA [Cohnella pontilimi]